MVDVLHDHELRLCQRAAHVMQVRQAHGRVGAGNPDRLERALLQSTEHLDGAEARLVVNGAVWPAPVILDLPPLRGILHGAIARQLV